MDRVRRWADDDLRSLNGQIEYLLRESLRRVGRLTEPDVTADQAHANEGGDSTASSAPEEPPEPLS